MLERPPIHRQEPALKPVYLRLLHWGPIVALSIVTVIGITSVYCHLMWWPPEKSLGGLFDLSIFLLWNYLCISNLLQASYIGPGYVPFGWRPANQEDQAYLQFCELCNGYKSPRAHHCRQCERCVMKMDHHCPWINNCCGHKNHGYFVMFLISAVIGCIHAVCIIGPSIYYAVFRVWYYYYGTGREPKVELGLYGLFAAVFSFGLAVGVVVAVGFLFAVQMRSILRNRTGIEDYIVTKALQREREDEFVYPYNLGWKKNLQQVFTKNLIPPSDGFVWPVKEGCHQYTLTIEQIEQKRYKRMLAVEYEAVKPYHGGWWISRPDGGCGAMFSQPCLPGDVRLNLNVSDRVLVTRWRRHWYYGEKKSHQEQNGNVDGSTHPATEQRGWFPRRCVVEVANSDEAENSPEGDTNWTDGTNASATVEAENSNGNVARAAPVDGHQKVE